MPSTKSSAWVKGEQSVGSARTPLRYYRCRRCEVLGRGDNCWYCGLDDDINWGHIWKPAHRIVG